MQFSFIYACMHLKTDYIEYSSLPVLSTTLVNRHNNTVSDAVIAIKNSYCNEVIYSPIHTEVTIDL